MQNAIGHIPQRVGVLAGLPALVSELGGSTEQVFAGSGLAASELRPDRYISMSLFVELLERAVTTTGRPDFALQLGLRQSPLSLGPVGRLMTLAPTLGHALSDFVSFQINNSRGAAVYLHRIGDDFALGIGIYGRTHPVSSLPYDLSMGVGCSLVRELTQGHTAPQEIMLNRREPKDPAPYHRLAQCPVRFDQTQCCIILSKQQLAHKLPSVDTAARAILLSQLNEALSRAPWGVSGKVRHALRPALLQGRDSLREVARALDLHHRSLERHLKNEGASFDAIKDEVRFTLARELLALTSLPVGEIGASLSYGSHSSFVHAFQRWAATTPTKWRQEFVVSPGKRSLP
jgi:AraC-like DNA-binding protein